MMKRVICFAMVILIFGALALKTTRMPGGPRKGTVLIIRHAEKPVTGGGLSQRGVERAEALAGFFGAYKIDGKALHLDAIYAASDSKESQRPRVTVAPLGRALGLPVDARFKTDEVGSLVAEISTHRAGQATLVSWRHGEIPELLEAFGVRPTDVLPGGKWPDGVFDWIIELQFDDDGIPIPNRIVRKSQHLLPGDL